MKRNLPTIFGLAGILVISSFLAWAFSQHGTIGLYRVNGNFQQAFLILGFVGLVLLVLVFLIRWTISNNRTRGQRWLSVITVLLSLPAIIMPLAVFSVISGIFSPGIGDTPPQLLVADGVGEYGVPDIAIAFNTATATSNTLTWGLTDTTTSIEESTSSKQHIFMLRDLQPGSTYLYRVNDGAIKSFTTPDVDGTVHLAVASDAHFGADDARQDLTAAMLSEIADPANDFDMIFFLGDLVEYGFQTDQWQQAFQTFSTATATIPVSFAAGNHDTLFSGLANYKDYCYPAAIDLQTGSQLWHRIDIGTVHILVLDLEWSAESYTAEQAKWLETQLMNIPADDWKIVMSHGFYYCSGSESDGWNWYDNPETIEPLTPLFEQYHVDMVFSGHNHRLELLQYSDVVYVIGAAFGGLPDPESTYISPASVWSTSGEYGFIDVTIDGNRCDLIFRDSDYEVLETYTLYKD